MGSCLSAGKTRRTPNLSPFRKNPNNNLEYEEEPEEVSDEEQQKSKGWNQYNQWVREHLLEKWSDEADERRNRGLPAKEIDEERLVEMIMFGIASNQLRGVV
jgi:hypothetical protein